MRRGLLVAGNWKMNTDLHSAGELARRIESGIRARTLKDGLDVAVCPPFVTLPAVFEAVNGSSIAVGAQNMSDQPSGAFTGEISGAMLRSVGCELVILGHSERRQFFGETDRSVNAKCRAAQRIGLRPIVCVGEDLDQRTNGMEKDVVAEQVRGGLAGLDTVGPTAPVVAYEPVWAIGTGRTATPEQAQEMHSYIRTLLAEIWDGDAAVRTRILYGGSMKPANARELFGQNDIDGGLVGGASLDASSFLAIIDAALEVV